MSSRTNIASETSGAEEFTHPPAPSGQVSAPGDSAQTRQMWAEKTGTRTHSDSKAAAQKERQAWNKGHEAKQAEARAAFEQQISTLRGEFSKTLHDFTAEGEHYFQRVQEQVLRLTLAIARKILHREVQVDPLHRAGILRVAPGKN